jgi:hypothetical protein
MHKLAMAVVAAVLAGCSGGIGTMDAIMKSWDGAPLDAVIAQWGYPHQEQNIAGRKIYRWYHNKSYSMPATSSSTVSTIGSTAYVQTTTTGGGTLSGNCERIVEVDERNMVKSWQWSGNNCPMAEMFEYSHWRRKS